MIFHVSGSFCEILNFLNFSVDLVNTLSYRYWYCYWYCIEHISIFQLSTFYSNIYYNYNRCFNKNSWKMEIYSR